MIPLLTLITLPSASTMLTDLGAWSSPFFTDMLPFIAMIGGLSIFAALVSYIISALKSLFN